MSAPYRSTMRYAAKALALALAIAVWATPIATQSPTTIANVDSLISRAIAANPALRAARARLEAAHARVNSAGARPDPMLMAGIQNLPVSQPGLDDEMTMKMVGIGQTVPYPGKLRLRTRIAEFESAAAALRVDEVRLTVARDVASAYYDLLLADLAFDVVRRNQQVLAALIPASEGSYSSGVGAQGDVLRLRIEAARLADEATRLKEERRSATARLSAVVGIPVDVVVGAATIPDRIARLVQRDSAAPITFVSPTLGSRIAGSPIPPVEALQSLAVRQNPSLKAHESSLAAQAARVELASKEHLPDFDVSLQYGQRDRLADMVTATISIPLPLQKRRKQDAQVAESRAQLAALEAEHHAMVNELRASVAELHSALERGRSQLLLYRKTILPQARAALASSTAGYQVGRGGFTSLLESQVTVFQLEIEYQRALTDFAKTLALLAERVGGEVIP